MRRYLIALLLLSSVTAYGTQVITNPYRTDGFGAQFQSIISSILFADYSGGTFCYTPFVKMEHNYNDDPHYLEKKEWLINLIGHFPTNTDRELQSSFTIQEFTDFFESHLDYCAKSEALKRLKYLFGLNKRREDYLPSGRINIVMHIRRFNQHDSRLGGTETPDSKHLEIISKLRSLYENPLIHIVSQGSLNEFREQYQGDDIILHLDDTVEDAFSMMVFADVLVTTTSSFSYTAAILSDGIVYYMPFWHPPLPTWTSIDTLF